jgi:WD40 repeat protein
MDDRRDSEGSDGRLLEAIAALEALNEHHEKLRNQYSKLRSAREKATFIMMMRMNPAALTAIRKEFFMREDSVVLDEFIYIIQKHLMSDIKTENKGKSDDGPSEEQREFLSNMYELFKDIDVNGDGDLEWEEFTTFTVDKANQLNKKLQLQSIAQYDESTSTLDASADYRHRHDISKFCNIPASSGPGLFAMTEDYKNAIFIFNSRLGKHIHSIYTAAAPIAMQYVASEGDLLVTSISNMTMETYSIVDPNPARRYKKKATWTTPGVQMSLTYIPSNRLLYSGATDSNIYSWKISNRSLVSTFSGHQDIVMGLIGLEKLDNIASASLDKTIILWDTYTKEKIMRLQGHKKGIIDIAYSEEYRLLVSCGFEHDVCVWSPFVNNMVFRLKGHGNSLVGCVTVPNTPEIITADVSGEFRLWDMRNFQCVQVFSNTRTDTFVAPNATKLAAFMHCVLPPRTEMQKENDSRIYAAAKNIFSFDQERVVHGATTDFSNVQWLAWNEEASVFITASERNVMVWDALVGSKTITNSNICGNEITACCLDDRMRKMIIGDVRGTMTVYNHLSGAEMKTVQNEDNPFAIIALEYVDADRHFIAGFANGVMRVYDENSMEDCTIKRTFDRWNFHLELLCLVFNPFDEVVATAGASSDTMRFWDYDSGKMEEDIRVCDENEHIVIMKFLYPYPIVATSDSRGNVILWTSKKCRKGSRKICGFMNQDPCAANYEPRKRVKDGEEEPPLRIFPSADETVHDISSNIEKEIEMRKINRIESDDEEEDDDDDDDGKDGFLDMNTPGEASSSVTSVDFSLQDSVDLFDQKDIITLQLLAKNEFESSETKWGKTTPAQCIDWNPQNYLLFTGDDLGHLRCFSLKNALLDIGGSRLARDHGKHLHLYRQCKVLSRQPGISAPPPIRDVPMNFMVGAKFNAMSYLGVDFKWSVTAHDDRIITMKCTPEGVLTSGADMLVKMWNFNGEPVGVLLQSVPSGARARSWKLQLDVEGIMAKENEELDVIIDDVEQLKGRIDELPDIETYDFSGLEPGSQSADYSQTELRQRIEKTKKILGIDFPTEAEVAERRRKRIAECINDDSTVGSETTKSIIDAMQESRSNEPSKDDALEQLEELTPLQQKQYKLKVENIANMFEQRTGIPVQAHIKSMQKLNERTDKELGEESSRNSKNIDDLMSRSDDAGSVNSNTSYRSKPVIAVKKPPMPTKSRASIMELPSYTGKRGERFSVLCSQYSANKSLDQALGLTKTTDVKPLTVEQKELLLQAKEKRKKEYEEAKTFNYSRPTEKKRTEATRTDTNVSEPVEESQESVVAEEVE